MKKHTYSLWLALLVALNFIPALSAENEIGFIEKFTLAENREEALKELIPGTEDYYYYHALHDQNEGRFVEVEKWFQPWIKRYGETQRVWELRHRQALLSYGENPKASLDYLRRHLSLSFSHRQQKLNAKPNFPSQLDAKLMSWQAYLDEALRRSDTLAVIEDSGIDRFLRDDVPLTEKRRRALLVRLPYPDYPQLVKIIAADLQTRESRGFGEFAIHRALLPGQLDELSKLRPALLNDMNFVNARILKMRPSEDVEWQRDQEVREAYLNQVWDFVKTLQPYANSLKAHTLYQLLQHYQRKGEYPRDLFMDYVRLPRRVAYMEPKYLQGAELSRHPVDLNANFQAVTACPPIVNDESLVRDYLSHYFVEARSWQPFDDYIRSSWLKPLFAETKLLKGVGDSERWFSLLTPGQVKALKERVDVEFAPTNAVQFEMNDEVILKLGVKNVSTLMVKVYEINALNYFLDHKREINTDLNLDGLIANEEKIYQYKEAAIRRLERSFTFDSLKGKRGVWVIEFIGNGRSSRALVRKGRLQYLTHATAAGTVVDVFDQQNQKVKNAAVWFGGRKHQADEDGLLVLPFSNQPGRQPMILTDGDFSTLEWFDQPGENYVLESGFFVDRENLLPGKEVELVVRPRLKLNGQPVPVSVLQEVKLIVRSQDMEGIESVDEVADFKLFDDRESLHRFRVPGRLMSLRVELRARVGRLSGGGEKVDLASGKTFSLNGIDQSAFVAESHLSRIDGQYVLEVLGKTGEALVDRAVRLEFKHRNFKFLRAYSLKSDAQGRVLLGRLEEIESLNFTSPGLPNRHWQLNGDRHTYPASIHGKAGGVIEVPLMDQKNQLAASDLALFETRAGTFVGDAFKQAKVSNGLIRIAGLEAGNYELYLRGAEQKITLRITGGKDEEGYLLSQYRHLEMKNQRPLQVVSLSSNKKDLEIQLANVDPLTRVHVMVTRFVPDYDPFLHLGDPAWSEPLQIGRGSGDSLYVSGRDIGEEYRYILERRQAVKFPGNMLGRPSLLLNPWSLRSTATEIAVATRGQAYVKSKEVKKTNRSVNAPKPASQRATPPTPPITADINFLHLEAPVFYNLLPDENGVVKLKRSDMGDRQEIHVLAINASNTAYRRLALKEGEGTAIRDLRLTNNLDAEKHYSQRRRVTVLQKGKVFRLEDLRSSELETYDTVAGVYSALAAVNPDLTFAEFAFVKSWPSLNNDRKQELYSKYASHELNFFLSRRDPDFFQTTIQAYLKNKKDKTFFDDYLIGADLKTYMQPWQHGRLNALERILLGRRLGGAEPAATARHLGDLYDLLPPNVEQEMFWFRSALRGRRLGGGAVDSIALVAAMEMDDAGAADPFSDGETGDTVVRRSLGKGLAKLGRSKGAMSLADRSAAKNDAKKPAAAVLAEEALVVAPAKKRLKRVGDKQSQLGYAGRKDMQQKLERARRESRANFRKMDETYEWAENNYYHLPIEQQMASLIEVNAFWRDYAAWDGEGGFYSRDFPAATRNFAEMMLALSVFDVPFKAGEHKIEVKDNTLTLTAASPVIVFHEEVEETPVNDRKTPILVSQNFFRNDDRIEYLGNEPSDKFVADEFLTGVLYGGQVVVTNPTSSTQRLDLLLQIPRGALPANGSDYTRTQHVQLAPFSAAKQEFYFYFPASSGEENFPHYPVQIAKEEKVIAWAKAFSFKVRDQLSTIDKASWEYLSQYGTEAQVIDFLNGNNINRVELGRIAWRVRENAKFLKKVVALLERRHVYDQTLWSYGIFHNVLPVARQFLFHREDFLRKCGGPLESQLVSIEPVLRHWYQHLEYSPLVNARSHRLGSNHKILNDGFRAQYLREMKLLSYRPEFDDDERLAVAYYLLLQDRVGEGLQWLRRVNSKNIETRLQLDYLNAYAALYQEKVELAGEIAAKYVKHPVDRWRERFQQVAAQVKEIEGAAVEVTDKKDREQQQDALAAGEPSFDLESAGQSVALTWQNLNQVRVNYYEMDLEFLFSSNPFVTQDSGRFSTIRPNLSEVKALPKGKGRLDFSVPKAFAGKNVLVEVLAAGQKKALAVYANSLKLQVVENYGRLNVHHAETGKPLSKVYVKVYARSSDGKVRFFKDGYTDLRGKFDYVSLNTSELSKVVKLSLLVMSEKEGALVREVTPPKQ